MSHEHQLHIRGQHKRWLRDSILIEPFINPVSTSSHDIYDDFSLYVGDNKLPRSSISEFTTRRHLPEKDNDDDVLNRDSSHDDSAGSLPLVQDSAPQEADGTQIRTSQEISGTGTPAQGASSGLLLVAMQNEMNTLRRDLERIRREVIVETRSEAPPSYRDD